ncbi:hypothetical protein Tsubulata_028533 [Turnera subulata]|uniref:Uncharacterized protein n=1 Tax=Turnera subulata TaxID=218843 RepID=A0A9Q0FG49_9ROSI|nr:hypothetical protein Tsubulata_028533 [Turnera subulata]
MASVSMAMPLTSTIPNSQSFLSPLSVRTSRVVFSAQPRSRANFQVKASLKEKVATGITAAALTASMVIPEVAEAAGTGVSPSLKNFLLSIVAGGVVLVGIVGVVVAISNFDRVKRS